MATLTKRSVVPDDAIIDLPSRNHRDGCPENPDRLDWEVIVPSTGENAGVEVARIRCVDCGGETLIPVDSLERDSS